jgi:hypothetical protein
VVSTARRREARTLARTPGLRAVAAGILALVLAVTSCTTQHPGRQQSPIPAGLLTTLRGGTVYLLIGPPASANLWLADHAHPAGERLTANPPGLGISWASASAAGLALADARTSVDVVSSYHDHRVQPLPAAQGGSVPAINPSGAIAYIGIPGAASGHGPDTWRVELTAAHGSPSRTLYQQPRPDLGAMAWGPDDQLAVVSSSCHGTSQILILDSRGRVRTRLHADLASFCFLAWNTSAPGLAIGSNPGLALTGTGARAEMLTTSGKQTMIPPGWLPMCWNPDGTTLLVAHGSTIGLWRPNAPAHISPLGTTGRFGPLNGCSWLPRPAAGTS